jgi:uncharacterized delta-60 repeat protein
VTAYRVYRNGVLISGTFETGKTFTAPVQPDGTADFTFTAVDVAGNESASASPALSVTIDTAAPAATSAPDLQAASDSGYSATDNITNDTTPTFDLAPLPAGTFYRIYRDDVLITGRYETAGTFTTAPQPDGAATYSIRVVDAAGNESAGSELRVTVVTSATPTAPYLSSFSDTGISNSDHITKDTVPEFVVPGSASFRIFRDGVEVGGGAKPYAYYYEHTPLAEGVYSYRAILTDLAGNVSTLSEPLLVTIDTTAPASPPLPDLQTASDSGLSNSDNVTGVARPTLDLSVGAGNYYWVTLDGNWIKSAVPASTYTPGIPLADGPHTISVAATDVAGNSSAFSPELSFTLDATTTRAVHQAAVVDRQFADGQGWEAVGSGDNNLLAANTVQMADGRIVTGKMHVANGTIYAQVYRFLPDGRPDVTFGQNGLVERQLAAGLQLALAVGPDGSVVLATSPRVSDPAGGYAGVLKLTPEGVPDKTFFFTGQRSLGQFNFGFRVRCVSVQADGKVVVGGCVLTGSDIQYSASALVRFNADGSFDQTLGPSGLFIKDVVPLYGEYVSAIIPRSDGGILATLMASTGAVSMAALRVTPDGRLDTSYGDQGIAPFQANGGGVDGGFLEPDGKLLVYSSGGIARFNADGSRDTSFAGGGLARPLAPLSGGIVGVVRLADGRYLALEYGSRAAWPRYLFAFDMFTAGGVFDPTFGEGGAELVPFTPGRVEPNTFLQTSDGRLLAAGDFAGDGWQVFLARYTLGDNVRLSVHSPGGSTGGNVTAPADLVFDAVRPDDYYRVYRSGTLISDSYANSEPFTAVGQPDGTWDYTVTSVDLAGNESAPSKQVRVTIDATPPRVLSARFDPAGSGGSVRVGLSEGISNPSVAGGPTPSIAPLDGGATGAAALSGFNTFNVSYDAGAAALTLKLGGVLSDGNYRLTLPAGWLRDAAGNPMSADFTFDFYVLAGDANRDRTVDFTDLTVLSQHYNTTGGQTWATGDFNGDGNVDFNDLVILAQRYNTTLAAPPALLPAAPVPAPALGTTKSLLNDDKSTKSVFSTKRVPKPAPLKKPIAVKRKFGAWH